ncbi:hypothetical protein OG381_10925 [Streptomyces sp. NBC_00490]|uniref:hypothetical protein n=1 Tax=Streptomyces sp. NBC_00490 TaxID=2903657 RepID=UPI002E183E09
MADGRPKTRWERRTEVPLAVASLVLLASYVIQVLAHDLPDYRRTLCLAATPAA